MKRNPDKIDIGAVFSHSPKDKNAISNFTTEQRELVFDIDLTDYGPVRLCGCKEANVCPKCWVLMSMAVKVMDRGLKEDFGFSNVAWFFSGRRGVHCWVCDVQARKMSNDARAAVVAYFELIFDSESKKDMLATPLHPALMKSYELLEPMFLEFILPFEGQGLLATKENWRMLLETLPPAASNVKDKLMAKYKKTGMFEDTTPEDKWSDILKYLTILVKAQRNTSKNKASKNMPARDKAKIESWKYETVFRYTYPRLDVNVSKMQNHLLKTPFGIHPKTGKVCIPLDVEHIDDFDPRDAPTLSTLRMELDAYKGKEVEDWKKTSLRHSFEFFQQKILAGM